MKSKANSSSSGRVLVVAADIAMNCIAFCLNNCRRHAVDTCKAKATTFHLSSASNAHTDKICLISLLSSTYNPLLWLTIQLKRSSYKLQTQNDLKSSIFERIFYG